MHLGVYLGNASHAFILAQHLIQGEQEQVELQAAACSRVP
jgi:hypothetical protein